MKNSLEIAATIYDIWEADLCRHSSDTFIEVRDEVKLINLIAHAIEKDRQNHHSAIGCCGSTVHTITSSADATPPVPPLLLAKKRSSTH